MRYLLDTNVLSEPLKPKPNKSVIAMMERHEKEIATCSLVWHELHFGLMRLPKSRKREVLEYYLKELSKKIGGILPYDEKAAKWHAEQRARLMVSGRPTPFVDGQIAAIARVNGLILVTRNESDYRPFSSVITENWHELEIP